MVNTEKLEQAYRNSGLTKVFIADHLNITTQALGLKTKSKTDFKLDEVKTLVHLLQLSAKDRKEIFGI